MNNVVLRWNICRYHNGVVLMNPPPGNTPILVCDDAGNMAVCVFDPYSKDFILNLEHWRLYDEEEKYYDSDGNIAERTEQTNYFPCPCAWMELPRAPLELILGEIEDEQSHATFHYPIMEVIEQAVLTAFRNKNISPWGITSDSSSLPK